MKKFRAAKNKIEEDKKRRCSEDSTTESELEQQEAGIQISNIEFSQFLTNLGLCCTTACETPTFRS